MCNELTQDISRVMLVAHLSAKLVKMLEKTLLTGSLSFHLLSAINALCKMAVIQIKR